MSCDHFKRFSNLQARAALQGVQLRAIRNDYEQHTFILTREHVTAEMPSLDAVAAWLEALPAASMTEGQSA